MSLTCRQPVNMNRPNYNCPVNSSTQVAGQFPSQAYLFVYIIKSPKPGEGYNKHFLISILPPVIPKSAWPINSYLHQISVFSLPP